MAFEKIGVIIEDSGWKLHREGEQVEDEDEGGEASPGGEGVRGQGILYHASPPA